MSQLAMSPTQIEITRLNQQRVVATPSVLAQGPLKQQTRGESQRTRRDKRTTRQMCATWILRVEAEHRTCKRAEVRRLGAEEAETDGLDTEDTRRSADQRKHAIRHNESTLRGHQDREEDRREPKERRDELACTNKTLQELPRQEAAEEAASGGEASALNPSRRTEPGNPSASTEPKQGGGKEEQGGQRNPAQKGNSKPAEPFGWRKNKCREGHSR